MSETRGYQGNSFTFIYTYILYTIIYQRWLQIIQKSLDVKQSAITDDDLITLHAQFSYSISVYNHYIVLYTLQHQCDYDNNQRPSEMCHILVFTRKNE